MLLGAGRAGEMLLPGTVSNDDALTPAQLTATEGAASARGKVIDSQVLPHSITPPGHWQELAQRQEHGVLRVDHDKFGAVFLEHHGITEVSGLQLRRMVRPAR